MQKKKTHITNDYKKINNTLICFIHFLQNKIQGFFYDVAVSTRFELAIVVLIVLNMFAMAVEHYNQSEAFNEALDVVNVIFTSVFTMEAVVKIIGLRWHYFRRAWNVYDFIIVVLSVIGE